MQSNSQVAPEAPLQPPTPNPERLVSQPERIASLDHLRTTLKAAGAHLGDILWWSLTDATLDRAALESIWLAAGLPREFLPEPTTAEKALRLAVRENQVGEPSHLIRVAEDSDRALTYAIVREERLGEGVLAHRQEARVTLNRGQDALTSDAPAHPLANGIQDAFGRLRNTHTADDVRKSIVKTLRSFSAVTLREGGGIYWVPRSFAGDVRRLEQAVRQLGASQLYVVPVHQTEGATHALGTVAKGSLETELAALNAELEQFKAEPPERTSTLERRLEAFVKLRSRAQLYRDILQVQVTDLESHLDAMAASVQKLISGVEAQRSAA